MHPGPDHFLIRPGTKEDGKPGPIVPLIAVDQLPDWMQLVGVPRELDAEQTPGLTNLGIIDKADDAIYQVRLHHDKIRAILNGTEKTTSSSSSGSEGEAKKTKINKVSPSEINTKTKLETSKRPTSSSSQGVQDDNVSKTGIIIGSPSSAPVHKESTSRKEEQEPAHPAERMLSASRHNTIGTTSVAGTAARGGKPIRPHMTQAVRDRPHRPQGINNKGNINGNPDTVFCRHWCHHGRCKWGFECRYQHRMPTTFEGLREVGLKDFPMWYLLMMMGGGSSSNGFPSMATHPGFDLDDLLGGLDMGNPLEGTTMFPPSAYLPPPPTTTPTYPNPDALTPHHPSELDLRLMQGRITALLAGPNAAAMSNRQRLRQAKEMRDMLTRGSGGGGGGSSSRSRTQDSSYMQAHHTHRPHHACASLDTNASVAANAAYIRRQAERQLLSEGRQHESSERMQMSDMPIAARAGRGRAVVVAVADEEEEEEDDDDGCVDDGVDEVRPEDSVSRAGRDGVESSVEEGNRHSLL